MLAKLFPRCISVGTSRGFQIFRIDPFGESFTQGIERSLDLYDLSHYVFVYFMVIYRV